ANLEHRTGTSSPLPQLDEIVTNLGKTLDDNMFQLVVHVVSRQPQRIKKCGEHPPHFAYGQKPARTLIVRADRDRVKLYRRSRVEHEHAELTSRVTGAMREEAVVVVSRAEGAERDLTHAERSRVLGDDPAKIDARRLLRWNAGESRGDVRAHLVASSADRRPAVHEQLVGGETKRGERADRDGRDPRLRAPPT